MQCRVEIITTSFRFCWVLAEFRGDHAPATLQVHCPDRASSDFRCDALTDRETNLVARYLSMRILEGHLQRVCSFALESASPPPKRWLSPTRFIA